MSPSQINGSTKTLRKQLPRAIPGIIGCLIIGLLIMTDPIPVVIIVGIVAAMVVVITNAMYWSRRDRRRNHTI